MSLCRDFETEVVCFTDDTGIQTNLVAHYQYGVDAAGAYVLVSTIYTDADGVPVDTSAGTVKPGPAPVASPDVAWEMLCDTLADGSTVNFLCRTVTSFDAAGAVIDPVQVDYFELDKVTPYVPEGTVKPAGACPPAVALGVLTAWGA